MKYDFVAPGIKYIGVDDLDIDLFEGQYEVPEGVSYNSYVILDEMIAVMDTADVRKEKEWMKNLEEALAGKAPNYIVVQHFEPDHSGCVKRCSISILPQRPCAQRRRCLCSRDSSTWILASVWLW